ncbi:MAG: hypothetical protein VBE63_00235 [Lamprobacter sp.]|uniref:hypothetical protein n=1 Tax=Lamprobacter sp. TaxID=3100796 RepID=UPI002B25CC78|nr:hypothetical protein [Lamprobacter sp.]MEA3638354.1 hypothetical protein [Lamprobacter sp.]
MDKMIELGRQPRVLIANGRHIDQFPSDQFNMIVFRKDARFSHPVIIGATEPVTLAVKNLPS